jgi:hypothetical protein
MKKKDKKMQKVLVCIIMVTWMVVGCEAVRQAGCYGYWVGADGHQRGTRWSNQNNTRPYRQCVEKEVPHKNTEKRPYG